ncbi:hypothetical protein [Ruegeria sp. MALMAid1280]|uniref:hypothetical protein n=1 Tax=Ruegeria sp. MALMAid1280 TaxID=3411634 RepID=UPI003B9DE53B
MSLDCTNSAKEDRLSPPAVTLLETARARLKRQAQYSRALSKGGARANALQLWLNHANDCIAALARPEAFFVPVSAQQTPGGVRLADCVTLEGADLERDVANGAQVTAYLLTLNYSQSQAFEWLDRDYGAHHVQTDLGSEVLFALGREAHRHLRTKTPTGRLQRVPVLASEQCGQRRVWSPADVQALLTCFEGVNPGVRVTDIGCFSPLNSILGLALNIPDR